MQVVKIPGEIPSKKNAYQRLASGRVFKPKDITDFEQLVEQCVMAYAVKEVIGEFSLVIRIKTKDNRRDVDNQATTIIDALQDAGVYKNDRYLISLQASKTKVEDVGDVGANVQILEGILNF